MSEEETYSKEQVEQYAEEMVRQYAQEKANIHTFFTKIIQDPSTTKTGNLNIDELGYPKLSVRTVKELELFCRDVEENETWADYFEKLAEITTSTSLSKEGFLVKLSVTQKKELADVSPKEKEKNSGWFKGKNSTNE
jgi:hypothetical protein